MKSKNLEWRKHAPYATHCKEKPETKTFVLVLSWRRWDREIFSLTFTASLLADVILASYHFSAKRASTRSPSPNENLHLLAMSTSRMRDDRSLSTATLMDLRLMSGDSGSKCGGYRVGPARNCEVMVEGGEQKPTGVLEVEKVRGKTTVTSAYARYPLKLVPTSRATDGDCAWVYALGYGGGAVCGDRVTISCSVGEDCAAALTTQGSTKVYKRGSQEAIGDGRRPGTDSRRASQCMSCSVAKGGLMAVIPDPVTCFEDASYRQHQQIKLVQGASLVLVDWMTSGRMSRGEGWDLHRFESCNEVLVEAPAISDRPLEWQHLIIDSLVLEDLPGFSVRERMLGMNVVGVVILVGPRVEDMVSALFEREARQRSSIPAGLGGGRGSKSPSADPRFAGTAGRGANGGAAKKESGKVISMFSRLQQGGDEGWCQGLVYRFAAERTEDAREALHQLLLPLQDSLGGRAPYA